MTKIQAYFPDELILEVKLRAKQEHKNFSEILREYTWFGLKNKDRIKTDSKIKSGEKLKKLKKYVGIIKTDGFKADQNAAEEIDKIVYGI